MALRIVILATGICAICAGVPASTFAQSSVGMAGANADDEVHLVGSWRVTQCPGPDEFFVLMAFNEGGTAFHTDQSSGVGNTGTGVWSRIRGRGNFAATFEEFQDTDSDGNADSRFQYRVTIHLVDRERLTGTVTVDHLSLDGTMLLATLGSCQVDGTRMRVIRE